VSTNPNAVYTANQNVPTSWTRLGFTFTANEANTRVVLDMNGNNTVATTFFIDDVKLVKN
jgi:endo-1,4-beta-xylanase